MRNDNSNNLIHRNNFDQNSLTYSQALSNMLNARWQHNNKGGVALNEIKYKVYHWVDEKRNDLIRWLAYVNIPNKKTVRKTFSGTDAEAKAWRFVLDIIDNLRDGKSIDVLVKPDIKFKVWVDVHIKLYLSTLKQSKKNFSGVMSKVRILLNYFGEKNLSEINQNIVLSYRIFRQ